MNNKSLQDAVLSLIPKKRVLARTSRELMDLAGVSFRELKEIITTLRMEHPICSRETDGGGYWIAESEQDIQDYVSMISRRRDGYNRTIEIMTHHIFDEEI